MYNLHVENKQTKKKPDYKKWQTAFVHHEKYTIYKWKHQQKHYTDHSLVFRQAGKKKKESGNIISHHKVKTYDFKTSKKRNKEILLRER